MYHLENLIFSLQLGLIQLKQEYLSYFSREMMTASVGDFKS